MEKAKKVFRVMKEYIIKYYVAFFVGGLVWMLLDVYVTKGIDASFVSAVMDSIMAGATILAILAAKNYLAQFTAQEGYKEAIELVNDVIPKLKTPLDKLKSKSEDAIKYLDGLNHTSQVSIFYNDNVSVNVSNEYNELKKLLAEIDNYLSGISTYGLKMESNKVEELHQINLLSRNIQNNLQDVLSGFLEFLDEVSKKNTIIDTSKRGTICVTDTGGMVIDKNDKRFVDTLNFLTNLSSDTALAINAYERLIAEPRYITKIFTVN